MNNLLQLCKDVFRGFVGGPDFRQSYQFSFQFEHQQLEVTLPESNVFMPAATPKTPETVPKYYPHTSTDWFSEHTESFRQHVYVKVVAKEWMYFPPVSILPSREYGFLSFQLRIKQTDQIDVRDMSALGRFVTQAHDDFQNGPEGINTHIRERIIEEFNRSSRDMTLEENQAEMHEKTNRIIAIRGCDPQAPAIEKKFNDLTWVFYRERLNNDDYYVDYYCLPLSAQSFLEIRFRYNPWRSDKLKKWQPHAMAAQERIMNSISLYDAPISQDPVLNHAEE